MESYIKKWMKWCYYNLIQLSYNFLDPPPPLGHYILEENEWISTGVGISCMNLHLIFKYHFSNLSLSIYLDSRL